MLPFMLKPGAGAKLNDTSAPMDSAPAALSVKVSWPVEVGADPDHAALQVLVLRIEQVDVEAQPVVQQVAAHTDLEVIDLLVVVGQNTGKVPALFTKPPDLNARCQKANSSTSSLAWYSTPRRGEKVVQLSLTGPKRTDGSKSVTSVGSLPEKGTPLQGAVAGVCPAGRRCR